MIDEAVSLSRPRATAQFLRDEAADSRTFLDKRVLLTGEKTVLATQNGKDCFLDSLLLLVRITPNLTVVLPEDPFLAATARGIIEQLEHPNKVVFVSDTDFTEYQAILSIGCNSEANLPLTTINSNGWLVRVCSRGFSISSECSEANPVGALAASSLGVSEVFKRLIALKPERGELVTKLEFSFYSYATSDSPGPRIPASLPIDLFLVGVGAIGNGIVHLLRSINVSGSLLVIDKQEYMEENLGTCLLMGSRDVGKSKALFAQELLANKLNVTPFNESVTGFVPKLGVDFPYPWLVLNAVDNIEARRQVQLLWPDMIIDGAIGELACEVTLHPWGENLSCLLCDFEEPGVGAEEIQSKLTGLRKSRLGDQESLVSDEDISCAPTEKKDWLGSQLGRPICSVISNATTDRISQEKQNEGFRPSVPFVACLSACMVIGELLRYLSREPQVLESGFQFDVLSGPLGGRCKAHGRKHSCICVQRADNIALLRKKRGLGRSQYV
ncbi:MAG: ThiF family adenylyltransferase [Bacteroidota bacterium]|jgi:molybdopterin/thiamine biosynthesis adenylyltransferase